MNIGDRIPEVLGFDAQGNEVKAGDFAGKKLVIYFYPKDNTPGCTAEACSLSEGYAELRKKGYEIVGVSKDSAASHQKFAEKYALPFTLIADTDLRCTNLAKPTKKTALLSCYSQPGALPALYVV